MKPFYVTTPIYYVNDLPHIGHIYTTIVADVIARYHRLAGEEVRFLTGTDEHGQKIERAAAKEGVAPLALADRVVKRYFELKDRMEFSYDDFIRTSEARHQAGVAEVIRRIEAAGDLYTAKHEGWYCPACELFYTEKELLAGNRCPVHEEVVEWKSEENVFFRLSRFEQPLLDLYEQHPEFVRPESRLNEVKSFVASGLKDLSVSRTSVSWGIPFPDHPGHTVYVWLDALINYVTALGLGSTDTSLYEKFWADPAGTRVNVVGKDILRFHAVFWPAFLLSAGLPLPSTVWAHGWWLRDGKKISKSSGGAIRPDDLVEKFGADALRYFLLRDMVFGQDASFSDEAFMDRYNSDLANDLGNTASRVVTLSRRAFENQTPPEACTDNPLIPVAAQVAEEYRAAMNEFAFSRALEALWRLLAEANQYIVAREPWKLIKAEDQKATLSRVLWNGLEAVRIVATGLLPFMPEAAARVLAAVGTDLPGTSLDALAWGGTPTGAPLAEIPPLFPRIDKAVYFADTPAKPAVEAGAKEEKKMISIDQFFETELKVATVLAAEPVPKSKKLMKLTLDLGEETPRTVVGGIAEAYSPEDLVGNQVVVVANLQTAKLMGLESQGMVLAATVEGRPVLLRPLQPVPPGTKVK
ncbi:MAG TPA: methionine--tRNA ligase [Thermoanaerobaculia bacterium]|nr:methionine--tRNA ligase [Thermoanaerobaculia bacterium]